MNYPRFETAEVTDPGLLRPRNEDAHLVLPEFGCCAVADGMGGGRAGDVASQMVVDALREALSGPGELDMPGRIDAVEQALNRVNGEIADYARERGFALMGSTVVLFLLDPADPYRGWIGHIGDSRMYCYRRGGLFRLTDDHTVGFELSQAQRMGSIDLSGGRLSHVLTRAIGVGQATRTDWRELLLEPGDLLLLTSDGLTTMITDEQIEAVFSQAGGQPEDCVQKLLHRALGAGGEDNITLICQKVSEKT